MLGPHAWGILMARHQEIIMMDPDDSSASIIMILPRESQRHEHDASPGRISMMDHDEASYTS